MIKIAIDLGSTMTKIYRADAGNGIVLAEPSCVAVGSDGVEVKAIGKEAKQLVGKTAGLTRIVFPIYEGMVVDDRLAVIMLKEFLNRAGIKATKIKRAEAVFSVPCGVSEDCLESYRVLAQECGLKKVYFVETPYLAVLGSDDAILSEADPVFMLNIGGGVTNAAVLSLGGIIAGVSMNVGGNNMDSNIINKLAREKGLNVGPLTAERVKNEIGSLSVNARGATVAEGSSVSNFRPASASVQASEISDCIRVYIDKVLEYAALVLNKLPAEVAAAVNKNGVFLSGGVAKISYVPDYISKKLEMRVRVCEEPQFSVVSGGGAVIRDKTLLQKISKKF